MRKVPKRGLMKNKYRIRLKAFLSAILRPCARHFGFFTREDAFQRKYGVEAKKTGTQLHKTAGGNKERYSKVRRTSSGASIWMPVYSRRTFQGAPRFNKCRNYPLWHAREGTPAACIRMIQAGMNEGRNGWCSFRAMKNKTISFRRNPSE